MKHIYSETVVHNHTNLSDEKILRSFYTWCGIAKLDPMLADQTHKIKEKKMPTRLRR